MILKCYKCETRLRPCGGVVQPKILQSITFYKCDTCDYMIRVEEEKINIKQLKIDLKNSIEAGQSVDYIYSEEAQDECAIDTYEVNWALNCILKDLEKHNLIPPQNDNL